MCIIEVVVGILLLVNPVGFTAGIIIAAGIALMIFFSVALRITSHYHRTLVTYLCALISMFFIVGNPAIWSGFLMISAAVIFRLLISRENKEQMRVKVLWMR